MPFKAVIRSFALKTLKHEAGLKSIEAAESHARRADPVAKRRRVRETDPLAWSKGNDPLGYISAFQAHKRAAGAGERKGAALAMEFKVIVSPDWLAENGADARSPDNPRVLQLVDEAKEWAESWGGPGAIWGWRYDTDERGAGVVDLFMSPVREQRNKNGKSKLVISCRKAKEELLAAERAIDPETKTSGAAMQSSWARWCQRTLDPRIERGLSKEITGREHVHADVYAAAAEQAKADAAPERERIAAEIAAEREIHEGLAEMSEKVSRDVSARYEEKSALETLLVPLRAAVAAYDAYRAEQARPLLEHWRTALDVVRSVLSRPVPSRWGFDLRALAVALAHPSGAGFVGREWSADPRRNLHDLERLDIEENRFQQRDALLQVEKWPDLSDFHDLGLMVDVEDAQAGDAGIIWPATTATSPPLRRHRAFLAVVVETFATVLAKLDRTPAPIPADAKLAADMPEEVRRVIRQKPPSGPSGP